MDKDKINEMIMDILDVANVSNTAITKWEKDFVESVQEQFIEKGSLSEKQEQTLERIWDKI